MRIILIFAVALNLLGAASQALTQSWYAMIYALVAATMSFIALTLHDALRRAEGQWGGAFPRQHKGNVR